MLQAHSLLWYYLWLAPNLLLLNLALLMWRRKLHRQFPVFFIFSVVISIEQLTLFFIDVTPSISPPTWWYVFWAGLLAEALVKFALIGEIFSSVFGRYPSVAKLGKLFISGVGVVLVLLATVAAVYTTKDNTSWIISYAHILEQTIFMVECGLILFLFLFAAYLKLHWNRPSFGIALGLGISACVPLATWALMANGHFSSAHNRDLLDILNMATYHVSVLIWYYYLLFPGKNKSDRGGSPPPPEHHLEVWNAELERLLHQ